MAKTQSQRTKDHLARIRRKAQAYDEVLNKFQNLQQFIQDGMPESLAAHHMRKLLDATLEKAVRG